MTPYFHDDHLTVYQGDCREVMAAMDPESVHCVVTSPPYWGLRDYGIGEKGIGLEPTPEAFVANMVAVFREVRRVLRKDGTLWLNLGDSYAGSWGNQGRKEERGTQRPINGEMLQSFDGYPDRGSNTGVVPPGLKPKDLVGIPWRVAFALQADGWYLRSDIIWAKPNPMPESVTDRPTKAHEYLFLLTKSARYYYDADAVREANSNPELTEVAHDWHDRPGNGEWPSGTGGRMGSVTSGRNLRSVWNIATEPYPGAHFATFPRKLVEPCVKAGTSERGVCPECGAPWTRETERLGESPWNDGAPPRQDGRPDGAERRKPPGGGDGWQSYTPRTTGWTPGCDHLSNLRDDAVPATVLDCFAGSGTTGLVAQSLGRRAVLIDLNGEYLVQAMARNAQTPLGMIG